MKKIFTRFRNIAAVFLVLFLTLQAVVSGQTSHEVAVVNNAFLPDVLNISAGDTVIWINTSGDHNVNGSQSIFASNPESFGNTVGNNWTFIHVFGIAGTYQYQCDPHVNLGMTGTVIVTEVSQDVLTIHFSSMGPHVGQTLWLSVIDDQTGEEVARISVMVEESFTLEVPGLEPGKDYTVDFYADFNGNGYYDAPPTDHAWRLTAEEISGNETVEFVHNTDFTDVEWEHRLRVLFSGMTPHVGQRLTLFVRDSQSGIYLDTIVVDEVAGPEFAVSSYVIEPGGSYTVDFYADHNGNGVYDAPPADHAWRLETGETTGDADLEFSHNVSFTDIFGTTGLAPESMAGEVRLYPNPARDKFYIVSGGEAPASVSVFSVTGARLKEVQNLYSAEEAVSLEGIGAGIYFVELTTADGSRRVGRLVVR